MLFILFAISSLFTYGPGTDSGHAVYVSVLEVTKQADTAGNLQIKVFTDDLEDAIFNQQRKRVDLQRNDSNQFGEEVSTYFAQHLSLIIDGKKVNYSYLSTEINDISVWLTFSIEAPETWKEVSITADYLMELFPTQSNIVSIKYKGDKRMFRLVKGDTEVAVSF